jgi:D-3-phosphoglycerate dehydrogenase
MYNIKKMNKISPVIYDYLPKEDFNVSSHLEDGESDALIVRSADCHGIDFPDRLLAIARAGAGVNNIPVKNAPTGHSSVQHSGANANGVKVLVLAAWLPLPHPF